MKPNATLSILDIEPYGSNTYPCELAVHWPTCGVEAVACGYVDTDSEGNFDPTTFVYGQHLSNSRLTSRDDWRSDWGMVITIPDGVEYTTDEVGKTMLTLMHRLKHTKIERI